MNNAKKLPKLSVAEFEIMKVLWERGGCGISAILKGVNRGRSNALTRSTIRVQVSRLIEKGWIARTGDGKTSAYCATVPRIKASDSIADDVKERVFNGSCLELIKALFRSSEISPDEIEEIRSLIEVKGKNGEPDHGKGDSRGGI